jgi:NTE family protein
VRLYFEIGEGCVTSFLLKGSDSMPDMTSTTSASKAENSSIHANAVFEGGGVRGIGHVGALSVAERQGYIFDHVAGTSAGAIIAALKAAGYSANEMHDIMREVDYNRFADQPNFDPLHVSEVFNFLARGGIHKGTYIEDFMREKLQAKGKERFGDLIIKGQENNPNLCLRYGLTVIASDISTGRMLRLPEDVSDSSIGKDPNDIDIARSVHMSASIPFFYVPVDLQLTNGNVSRIVDGGLLSNFPLFLFDEKETGCPTFGFRLVDSLPPGAVAQSEFFRPTNNPIQIMQALFSTLLKAHDKLYMDDHTYVRTIAIPVDGISSIQFNLTKEQADKLYQNGEEAAKQFFATWDFDAYTATYLSARQLPGRQERLHAEMKVA